MSSATATESVNETANANAVTDTPAPGITALRPHQLARALGLSRDAARTRRFALATAILAQDGSEWDRDDWRYCSHCHAARPVDEFYRKSNGTYTTLCKEAIRDTSRRSAEQRLAVRRAQREKQVNHLRAVLTAVASIHRCDGCGVSGVEAASTASGLIGLTTDGRRLDALVTERTAAAQLAAVLATGVTWWCEPCAVEIAPPDQTSPSVRGPLASAIVNLCGQETSPRQVYTQLRPHFASTSLASVGATMRRLTKEGVLSRVATSRYRVA